MAEKTEAPTGKRLADARGQGQVAFSREIGSAAAILVAVYLLRGPGVQLAAALKEVMATTLASLPSAQPSGAYLKQVALSDASRILPSMSTILVGLLVTGIIVTEMQTRLLFATKRLGFHFDHLNPLNGLKRIFSAQGLMEFCKALLKLLVVGWVAYTFLRDHATDMIALAQIDFNSALTHWAALALDLTWRVGSVYLILAFADYAYQRWRLTRSLKMTKEEVKEEMKQQEGDPMIKGRIRMQMRRMARKRMMANVPKADVIITNPTHLAVAVRYAPEEMSAPKVLAKGAHHVAERIVELARANRVPIVQNIPVARALYRTVEIDQEVPAEMYVALAEILAYVYRMKKMADGSLGSRSLATADLE